MLAYPRWNLILFLAVMMLGGVVWWSNQGEVSATRHLPLAACVPEAVQRIVIEHGHGVALTLERVGTSWRVAVPFVAPASAHQVGALLGLCQAPSRSEYPMTALDLTSLGLRPPRTLVHMDGVELQMGGTEPLQGNRYLLFRGVVSILTDSYPTEDDATRFVDPALLPEGALISGFSLPALEDSPAVAAVLVEGHWHTEPIRSDLSADVLPSLVDGWRQLHAIEIRRDSEATSLGRVTFTLAGKTSPICFEVLSLAPILVLRRVDLGLRYLLPYEVGLHWLRLPPPASDWDQKGSE